MYLFFFNGNHKGWYICSHVFDSEEGYTGAEKEGSLQAWCGNNPQQQPSKLHIPFYSKKCLKGGTILPHAMWAEARIAFI